jgi:transposase
MYVAITGSGKARVIQFREDTHIPGTRKKKIHVVKTIGNYERMLAEDPDIIEKLKEEARALTAQKKASRKPITVELSSQEITSPDDVTASFRFGHALVKQMWQRMALDIFFREQCNKRNAEAVERAIYYLTAHRLADPASILASSRDQENYAGLTPLGLDVFYQVLDILSQHKEAVIERLNRFFEKNTNRQGPEAYYDVTTYAFESTRWGELRMFGFSKDHKNNEVQVVMGLLLDNNGIPITYELFPGNTMDQNTLTRAVERLKEKYRLKKIVIVADRGLNSGDNLEYLYREGHDFVISYTLKRSSQELKAMVLDAEGWSMITDAESGIIHSKAKILKQVLKVKIPMAAEETAEKKRGRPRKYELVEIPVNIHLTWTAKRAAKDRADRERMIEKLKKRLDKPYQLKADLKRGRNQYLKLDVNTDGCCLDEGKIAEAERYDGYYAVITNNLDYSTEEITNIYGGLWQIEETFRVLKTDLRARPVFVWSDDHIQGHFMLCYLCLCILRYSQYLLLYEKNEKISASNIMDAFSKPLAIVLGTYPNNVVTPTQIPKVYLQLSEVLGLPPLKTNMTLTNFRAATKLDLSLNLK